MTRIGTARGLSVALGVILVAGALGSATSVKPASLGRAARRASAVVVGTVASVSCRRAATASGRTRIFTDVDLRDLSVAAGTVATRNVVLSVVGGTMDDRTLRVDGVPRFEEGRRYVVFLDPGEPLCGVAGWTRGVFRVARGTDGSDRVLTHDGAPVGAVRDGQVVEGGTPLALADFLSAVRAAAAAAPAPRSAERRAASPRIQEAGR